MPRHIAQHIVNPRRPFLRFTFSVDGLTDARRASTSGSSASAASAPREIRDALRAPGEPVVDVGLTGILGFDGGALESAQLEEYVTAYFKPLVVRIHDGTRDTDYEPGRRRGLDGRDRSTWQQLEVHIFQELLARDARYLPKRAAGRGCWRRLKQMALGGEDPAAITQRLREARAELWGAS